MAIQCGKCEKPMKLGETTEGEVEVDINPSVPVVPTILLVNGITVDVDSTEVVCDECKLAEQIKEAV